MDHLPLPPPFKVGTTLRYKGTSVVWQNIDGQRVPLVEPGLVVVISKIRDGRQGTLKQLRDADGPMEDDDGTPILDKTRDGYSVYEIVFKGKKVSGRAIFPKDKGEWEIVAE